MADWVAQSSDNGDLPFVIIDKPDAKVFVFDKNGQVLGSAWVLVGLAQGDDSVPGIGTMPLTVITPQMRTTPAGRFVAALGHDLGKLDVLWVDYPDAISLHRVINTDLAETAAGTNRIAGARRPPDFLWLHQCAGEIFR